MAKKNIGWSTNRLLREHMDCYVVRTGFRIPPQHASDFLIVAPGHNRNEEPVAARRGQVVLGPSQPDQVLAVVLQRQVGPHMGVAGNTSRPTGRGEDDRLLRRQYPLRPKDAARLAGGLDWPAVGGRARRPIARE